MASNTNYGQPAQARFMDTYVPLPMNQILGMVAQKENRYAQGLNDLAQQEGIIQSIQAVPRSADQQYLTDINNKLEGLVNNYAQKDLSDIVTVNQFHNEINRLVDKQRLGRIANSYKNWLRSQQFIQQAKLRHEYNPLLDKNPAVGWDSRNGIYNYTPPTYLPKEVTLDKYFNELNKPRSLEELGLDKFGRYKMGRTDKDINSVITKYAGEWLASQDGQNEVEIYKQQHPEAVIKNKMSDLDIAKDIMRDYGKRYKGVFGYSSVMVKPGSLVGGYNPGGSSLINKGTPTQNNFKKAKDVYKQRDEYQNVVNKYKGIPQTKMSPEQLTEYNQAKKNLDDYNAFIEPIKEKYNQQLDSISKETQANIIKELVDKGGLTPEEAKKTLDNYINVPIARLGYNGASLITKGKKIAYKLLGSGLSFMPMEFVKMDLERNLTSGIASLFSKKEQQDLNSYLSGKDNSKDSKDFWEFTKQYKNYLNKRVDEIVGPSVSSIIRDNIEKAKKATSLINNEFNKELTNAANVNSANYGGLVAPSYKSSNVFYNKDASGHPVRSIFGEKLTDIILSPSDYQITVNYDGKNYTKDGLDKLKNKGVSFTALSNNVKHTEFLWNNAYNNKKPEIKIFSSFKDKKGIQKDITMTVPLEPTLTHDLHNQFVVNKDYTNLAMLDAYTTGVTSNLHNVDITSSKFSTIPLGIDLSLDKQNNTSIPLLLNVTRESKTGDILYKFNDNDIQKSLLQTNVPIDNEGYAHAKNRAEFVNNVLDTYLKLVAQRYQIALTGL